LDFSDFDRFSLITSSIHMIFTIFFFEKMYFVKTRRLMAHLSTYDHYWVSYDQLTVSSVGFGNFDRFSLITSPIHMIFTIFFFEKMYFVKTRRLMAHSFTYDHYWVSYDQITVSSVGFGDFDRFSLITPSVYMIIRKFFFEKMYFVKTRRLMAHLSTYDSYWASYDQITVSSVGF
jgi:hypothetical protein